MPLIARLTDTSTHGGEIITAAQKWRCEGLPIARKTDILNCPIHGENPIIEGSAIHSCEDRPIARHGDRTECGAQLISGAQKWVCD